MGTTQPSISDEVSVDQDPLAAVAQSLAAPRAVGPADGGLPAFGSDDVPMFGDDWDDDDEITIVANLSEEMKALRKGYRQINPLAQLDAQVPEVRDRPVDDSAEIEVTEEKWMDSLLVEELLDDEPTGPNARVAVFGAGLTDRGRKRKHNEDSLLLMDDFGVYVVADGMGGHAAGEIASKRAVEVIEEAFTHQLFHGEPNDFWPKRGDELARSVEMANRAVFNQAAQDDHLEGMGTTLTAVRFSLNRQRIYIAHVGDSRCYRIRDGELSLLTMDHTIGNLLGAKGPLAQQLSRAVGTEPTVEVDLIVDEPQPGDRYLLCSDGLNKMLADEEITLIARADQGIGEQVQALIDESNVRGGKDNVTVIIINVEEPFGGG